MTSVDIVEHSCCSCGVSFWITDKHNKLLMVSKDFFKCPNGHSQNYKGKTPAEEKKELNQTINNLQLSNDELIDAEVLKDKKIKSLKGQVTKLKKKVS